MKRFSSSSLSLIPMPRFKTETFEGPLDLLLHLIKVNEVDIYDIPIAVITGQYLKALDQMESPDLVSAGEYLVLAATLIEIKARMLLPESPSIDGDMEDAEDPREELVNRLLDYQQFRATIEMLQIWEEDRRLIYFRGALQNAEDYLLPLSQGDATSDQLHQALHRILTEAGLDSDRAITTITPRRRLSLRLKMAELLRKLEAARPASIPFEFLFVLDGTRYDVVLTFLALLELIRIRRIRVEQADIFGPLEVFAGERSE